MKIIADLDQFKILTPTMSCSRSRAELWEVLASIYADENGVINLQQDLPAVVATLNEGKGKWDTKHGRSYVMLCLRELGKLGFVQFLGSGLIRVKREIA